MGLFIKVGTAQELEALEAGQLVEAAGQRIAIFNLGVRVMNSAPDGMACASPLRTPALHADPLRRGTRPIHQYVRRCHP